MVQLDLFFLQNLARKSTIHYVRAICNLHSSHQTAVM